MICREWQKISWCRELSAVVGGSSLQTRTCPALQRIVGEFSDRMAWFLRLGGFPEEDAHSAAITVMEPTLTALSPWYASLAPALKQKYLVAARSKVWAGRLVLLRVDRSPGRFVVLCCELWKLLQGGTFLQNSRYRTLDVPSASEDIVYTRLVGGGGSFMDAVAGAAG